MLRFQRRSGQELSPRNAAAAAANFHDDAASSDSDTATETKSDFYTGDSEASAFTHAGSNSAQGAWWEQNTTVDNGESKSGPDDASWSYQQV